jgi:signal transduction histidine kinase
VKHTRVDDAIAIGTSIGEDEWRMWVRDTGTGISISDQARIFDHFVPAAMLIVATLEVGSALRS